jgi:ankyrin repeat protein
MLDQTHNTYYFHWNKNNLNDPLSWKITQQKEKDKYKGKGSALKFFKDAQEYVRAAQPNLKLNSDHRQLEVLDIKNVIEISENILKRYQSSLWQKIVNLVKHFLFRKTELDEMLEIQSGFQILQLNINQNPSSIQEPEPELEKNEENLSEYPKTESDEDSSKEQFNQAFDFVPLDQNPGELEFERRKEKNEDLRHLKELMSKLEQAIEQQDYSQIDDVFKQMDDIFNKGNNIYLKKNIILKNVIELGKEKILKFLLDKEIGVDKEDLFYGAISYNQVEIAKILKERGVDINAGKYGSTYLEGAIKEGKNEIAKWLCEQDEIDINKGNCLENAILSENEEMIQLLLEKGINVNQQGNKIGMTPLKLAIRLCNLKLAEDLRVHGAQVDRGLLVDFMMYNEVSILQKNFKELEGIFQFLVKNGGDVNYIDNSNYTPLILACYYDFKEIVEFLLDYGADVNLQGFGQTTPLIEACLKNNIEIVELLINQGADLCLANRWGETPLECAKNYDDRKVFFLLFKHIHK